MSKARVSLVHGADRRTNVFNALELVRADVESRIAGQVMLKPNFLSSDNQLASSHADALRGVLDFLLTIPAPPREVIIAEAGASDTWDAYRNFWLPRPAGRVCDPPAPDRSAPRDRMGVDADCAGRRQRGDRAHAPHRPRLPMHDFDCDSQNPRYLRRHPSR